MSFPTLHIPTIIKLAELEALNKHGSIKNAAKELGIHSVTLSSHMRDYDIVRLPRTRKFIERPARLLKRIVDHKP